MHKLGLALLSLLLILPLLSVADEVVYPKLVNVLSLVQVEDKPDSKAYQLILECDKKSCTMRRLTFGACKYSSGKTPEKYYEVTDDRFSTEDQSLYMSHDQATKTINLKFSSLEIPYKEEFDLSFQYENIDSNSKLDALTDEGFRKLLSFRGRIDLSSSGKKLDKPVQLKLLKGKELTVNRKCSIKLNTY